MYHQSKEIRKVTVKLCTKPLMKKTMKQEFFDLLGKVQMPAVLFSLRFDHMRMDLTYLGVEAFGRCARVARRGKVQRSKQAHRSDISAVNLVLGGKHKQ